MVDLHGHTFTDRAEGPAIATRTTVPLLGLRTWRDWAPDAAVGLAVLLVGMIEVANLYQWNEQGLLGPGLLVVGIATAAGLARRLPSVALGLVWAIFLVQVTTASAVLVVELAVALVAFAVGRWARAVTVWLGGLSIPAAAGVVTAVVIFGQLGSAYQSPFAAALVGAGYDIGLHWRSTAFLIGMTVLVVPWLAGLVVRFSVRARDSQSAQAQAEDSATRAIREREQAEEITRLRDGQTRLARDVHDVVGHSLAVILAQSESGQYLRDTDTVALKRTLATIATSARSSLQDIRQVLATTQEPVSRPGELDSLIEGVRASGHEVHATEVGAPRSMPPELELVVFRVMQEMLTNAIKHGRRDAPVIIERHWDGELRIEVRNTIAEPGNLEARALTPGAGSAAVPAGMGADLLLIQPIVAGQGLEGMRRRLESAGGRLDVRRREESNGPTFTATAWVPVRTSAR